MKILLVSDTSSHMRGGVPAETRILIRGLLARGHAVALLSDAPLPGAEAATHWPLTVPVGAAFDAQLSTALRGFSPDVVHFMQLSTKGLLRLRRLLSERRWLVTVHSVAPHERKLGGLHDSEWRHYAVRYLRFLPNTLLWKLAFVVAGLPRVIVHSRYVGEIVQSYGYDMARVSNVSLPIDGVRASLEMRPAPIARSGRLDLVTVGGIAHTKGQHDVVLALPEIRERFPTVRARFVGEVRDSSYAKHLMALGRRLGVAAHIELLTQLSDVEKNTALDEASVYVQPSHEEGFCLAYAEAATRVLRLVGTDTGAIAAISRGDAGARVVPPRNPNALARAILDIAQTSLPADLLQRRSARLTANFSERGYVEAHERLYQGSLT